MCNIHLNLNVTKTRTGCFLHCPNRKHIFSLVFKFPCIFSLLHNVSFFDILYTYILFYVHFFILFIKIVLFLFYFIKIKFYFFTKVLQCCANSAVQDTDPVLYIYICPIIYTHTHSDPECVYIHTHMYIHTHILTHA